MIPSGFEAFVVDAELDRTFLLEGSAGNLAQEGNVLGAEGFAPTSVVFTKGDVQDSLQAVFNLPVTALGGEQSGCRGWQAGDGRAVFERGAGRQPPFETNFMTVWSLGKCMTLRRATRQAGSLIVQACRIAMRPCSLSTVVAVS
jgi:hypothetical protein